VKVPGSWVHARIERTGHSSWEDPSLVQMWGPRYSTYVAASRYLGVFSLARIPDDGYRRLHMLIAEPPWLRFTPCSERNTPWAVASFENHFIACRVSTPEDSNE
jgi:hypothetical protein